MAGLYVDLREAFLVASAAAPMAIGWKPGGWQIYNLETGAPTDVTPEFVFLKKGSLPLPLSTTAAEALLSAIRSETA